MDLRDASLGFYRVWHAAIGARTGLLALLAASARTPAQAARALRLDERAVAKWCRGAEATGLLARRGDAYFVPRALRPQLADPDDARYLGHHFDYLARKSLQFGALDDLMRGEEAHVDLSDVYAVATQWDHLAFFEQVLPRDAEAARVLKQGGSVLDLGAGHGRWAAECARRYPRARVTAAEVRGAAYARLREEASARIRVATVDDLDDDAYDLVFMGEVMGAARDPLLPLATAQRVLRPGGRLRALEGLAPPRDKAPRGWGERLVLAMGLDFALDGSRFLTTDEAAGALRDAGFVRRSIRDLGGSLFALRARKRQTRPSR